MDYSQRESISIQFIIKTMIHQSIERRSINKIISIENNLFRNNLENKSFHSPDMLNMFYLIVDVHLLLISNPVYFGDVRPNFVDFLRFIIFFIITWFYGCARLLWCTVRESYDFWSFLKSIFNLQSNIIPTFFFFNHTLSRKEFRVKSPYRGINSTPFNIITQFRIFISVFE